MDIDLPHEIEARLPAGLVSFLRLAGGVALAAGQRLYLVGGVVRDLLLGRPNLDLDLVVEGDAIKLAGQLAAEQPDARLTTHARFNTARLIWDGCRADLTSARSETYARPGALPTVAPGILQQDLFRRDFTINAMAIDLNPGHYGELVDPYGGRADLERRLVRVLHEHSFVDDATRIWRGLRYEQRLGFRFEKVTLELLKRDAPMLDTISGDRLRHELELALNEEYPEKVLRRADQLGVLARLHPSLRGDTWLARRFAGVRRLGTAPSLPLYLALLTYRLEPDDMEALLARLRFPAATARLLRDTVGLRDRLAELDAPGLAPSRVYHLVHDYSPLAVTANLLAADSPSVHRHLRLYLDKWRYVKSALTGDDLKRMGIPEGPRIKQILEMLLNARLDGRVRSRSGEVRLVRGWQV